MTTISKKNIWNYLLDSISILFSTKNKSKEYPLKIIDVLKNNDLHIIKVLNHGKIYSSNAEYLVNDDLLLIKFSPYDIRTICYYAYMDIKSPKYKIISNNITIEDNGTIQIRKRGNRKIRTININNLINDSEIIESLSPKETLSIGYSKAQKDNVELREKIKKINSE